MNKSVQVSILTVVLLAVVAMGGCAKPQETATPEQRGSVTFELKCQTCHKVNGQGGEKGPDLSTTGAVRNRQWLETYLKNPFAINPKSKMPRVQMTDAEIKDVAAYLAGLKAGQEEQRGKTD